MSRTNDQNSHEILVMEPGHPRDAFKQKQRELFFEELAATTNITASANKAGLALSTVYHLQVNDAEFAAAMMQALERGYAALEMDMVARMREGVERKIYYRGELKETVRDYDHKNAIRLLAVHKEAVAMTRAAQAQFSEESKGRDAADTLEEKLLQINKRLKHYRKNRRIAKRNGEQTEQLG